MGDASDFRRGKRTTKGFAMLFADRVKTAMDASGLGVKDWAFVNGLPYGTVLHVRNGHSTPALERAAEFAAALGVSLDWLVGNSEEGGP